MKLHILFGFTAPGADGIAPARALGAVSDADNQSKPEIMQKLIDDNAPACQALNVIGLEIPDDMLQAEYVRAMGDIAAAKSAQAGQA